MTSTPSLAGQTDTLSGDAAAIARQFVQARLSARSTPDYPGVIPQSMAQSYAIQDIAIGLFPDEVVGWKVGGVPLEQQATLGIHRLAGAIFARNVWPAPGDTVVPLPEIEGGFAAVESEFIARIGADADPAKTDWTIEELSPPSTRCSSASNWRAALCRRSMTLARPSSHRISATTAV